jgi:hypothetical protein
MALQHHFVVVVEDGKMFIDTEVSINFDSGSIWDTEQETWENSYDHYEEYEKANELLQDLLMKGTGTNAD